MSYDLNKEIVTKTDMVLSDLANGGLLEPEQSDAFIRTMTEVPGILNRARVVPMNGPTRDLDKVKFGSRILRAAVENTGLGDSDRAKVTTDQVKLETKEVIAEVRLNYQTLEDNIERGNFANTVRDLIAQQAALDIDELIIKGDTASVDSYLALLDGLLVQATSHTVDAAGDTLDYNLLTLGKKALPKQYRTSGNLAYIVASDSEINIRQALVARQTALGDSLVTGAAPTTVNSHAIIPVHKMDDDNALFTDAKNIIVGFQRKLTMEYEKKISERYWKIVVTARLDVKIEEEDAVVKYINVG